VDEWLCAYVCECLYVGVQAYACVKAYARIDACMGVGESCITGDALNILTSALTYTKHLHALSDAESEEARALLGPHVNESITTTSGETPQASAPVITTHMAPLYLHVLPGAVDGTVEALMDLNANLSSISNSGGNPHDGRGQTNVNNATLSSGTPARAATQPTPESAGCKRSTPDWP